MFESDSHKSPMHARNQEGLNALLVEGFEANDYILPGHNTKPSAIGDTDQPV